MAQKEITYKDYTDAELDWTMDAVLSAAKSSAHKEIRIDSLIDILIRVREEQKSRKES